MPVNYTAATVDAVVSVWVKLPKEVREKVIEATHRLIDFSKGISEDTTDAESSGVIDKMNELYYTLPAEVQQGVRDTLGVIVRNVNIEE